MKLKEKIKNAIKNNDEREFYRLNSILVYGKELPEFAYEWSIDLPKQANNKVLVLMAPRNHLKTTMMTIFRPFYYLLTNPLKTAWLFSYSVHQAKEFLNRLKNIVEYFYPEIIKPDSWSKTELGFINGSSYKVGSISSTYYGIHPDMIICDDLLGGEGDPQKIIKSNLPAGFVEERFFSMIVPMLSPESQLIVTGIPFFVGDLYTRMEQMSKEGEAYWIVKYPAIIDEQKKKVLWEKERSYEWLMQQKKKIGSQRFAREYLLKPFDAESSLIPSYLFDKALDYSMPVRYSRLSEESIVVVGADFSISAHLGSDYCVFVALEVLGDKIYVLNWERFKDADYKSQLDRLESFASKYNADLIVVETIAFQKIYAQSLSDRFLPILEHRTHNEKNTFNVGIPSLKLYFERNQIVLPAGDDISLQYTNEFLKEMQGFIYMNNKVLHIGQHDDMAMAFYLAIQGVRNLNALEHITGDLNILVSNNNYNVWRSIN